MWPIEAAMRCWMTAWIWVTWRTGPHVGQTWCVWTVAAFPSPPSTSVPAQAPHTPASAPTTGRVYHCHLHQGVWLHNTNNIINCAFLTQQTCSNEMKCICDPDYTGKDCSVFDPIPIPTPSEGPEKYRGIHTQHRANQSSSTGSTAVTEEL